MTHPKITQEDVAAAISSEEYAIFGGRLTVCVLTLRNGFLVTGESSCVSAENFNQKLGEQYAKEDAVNKVWQLEGYALRNKLFTTTTGE